MFGVMSRHLAALVNEGNSFVNATQLYKLLVNNPLKNSFFHLYKPQCDLVDWSVPVSVEKLSLWNHYLVQYKDGKCVASVHSRRGKEKELEPLKEFADIFFGRDVKKEGEFLHQKFVQ